MPYETPPILPYGHTVSSTVPPPPITTPLTTTFDLKLLEPYLPTPRTTFLSENPTPVPLLSCTPLPYVTLTYAQSLDGFISTSPGIQTLLSGPASKAMTHYLRTRHDAILIGAGTALADDPGLNSRWAIFKGEGGEMGLHRQPRPIVLDGRRKWKPQREQKLFRLAEQGVGRAPWWIVGSSLEAEGEDMESGRETIGEYGGEVLELTKEQDWEEILGLLAAHGVRSVMIEGGGSVIRGLLEKKNQKFVSSVVVTVAPTYLGQGGVGVAPTRSGVENEAHFSDITWLSIGRDAVMTAKLDPDGAWA